MSNRFKEPVLTVNKVYYTTEILNDEAIKFGGTPEKKRHYFRVKKRFYLRDVLSIEEYKGTNFTGFTKSPLTKIDIGAEEFIAEIEFGVMSKLLDQFDQNRIINILN